MELPADRVSQLILTNSAQQFKGRDLLDLFRPGVYVLTDKDGAALYIGYSKSLLMRMSPNHHRFDAFQKCESALFYPCCTTKDARELEGILIECLRPTLNIRQRYGYVRKALGIKTTHSLAQYGIKIENARAPYVRRISVPTEQTDALSESTSA